MAQDLTGLLGGALLPPAQPAELTSAQDRTRIMQEANKGFRLGAGGMFGVDTRTTPEFVQEEIAKLNPESVEDQAKIVELVGKINPAGAVALKSAFAQKSQAGVAQQEKKDAIVSYVKAAFPDKPELLDLAQKGISLAEIKSIGEGEKDYAIVGNSVYIPKTREFIQGPKTASGSDPKPNKEFNEETGQNELVWRDPTNPTIVLKRVKAPVDIATQSVFIGKQIDKNNEAARAAAIKATKADSIAKRFEETNPVGGIFSTAEEATKAFLGLQDKTSLLKIEANSLITGNAVQNLPRGPASDKDIALVLAGEPPANANWETMASYARGIAKMQRAEQEYFEDKALWFDMYGNETGFAAYKQKQVVDEELAGIFGQIPTQATMPDGRVINLRQDLLNNLDDPVRISEVQDALNKAKYDINFQELLNKKNKLEKIMQSTNRKGF